MWMRSGGDLWLRLRPGTDAALSLGLARWLMLNRAYDAEFVRDWTNAAFLVREDNGCFPRPRDLGRRGLSGLVDARGTTGRSVMRSRGG